MMISNCNCYGFAMVCSSGVTALYYAYELGSSRASDILLAHGADCSIRPGETGAFSKSLSPFPKQTNFGSRRCCNNSSECGVQ